MAQRQGSRNGQSQQQSEFKNAPPTWSRKVWTGSATVEVGVWEKVINQGQQNEFVAYNVSCKRVMKDEEGYKAVAGFRAEDIPHLIQLLAQANDFIYSQMNRE